MFAIVGLADAANHLLQQEGLNETFGKSQRGDEIATLIMDKLKEVTDNHEGVCMLNARATVIYYMRKWVQAIMKKINVMRLRIVFVWVKNQHY